MAKVHVIGAGPAGSISAISAARRGHTVIMSEEHETSGLPENCSGLFSKAGLESLSEFFDYSDFIVNSIRGADIFLSNEKLSVRTKEPVGFVCDRSAIDLDLAERAVSEGVKLNYNEKVYDQFHADNIIGADGPISSVARHFSFKKINRFAATLQSLVKYKCEDPHIVQVFLSNKLFPGFFSWIIPHDEYTAEIGAGVTFPNRATDAWQHFLKLKKIADAPTPKGAIIPLEVRSKTAIRIHNKNVLLVGDAAGQVKATTGGGVIFGGNCARLAGMRVTDPLHYEAGWRRRYGADLFMHNEVRNYLNGLSDNALEGLCRRLKEFHLDEYLSEHGHMDKPTMMLHPHIIFSSLRAMAGTR